MTRRSRISVFVAVLGAMIMIIGVAPAGAQSTEDQLSEARKLVEERKSEYQRLAEEFAKLEGDLYRTENKITDTEAAIVEAEDEIVGLKDDLRDRVRTAYRMGGIGVFHFLLEAKSFRDFSLRMITLQRQTLQDEDLIFELRHRRAELERKQRELDNLKGSLEREAAAVRAKGNQLTISLQQARALERDLSGRLRREQIRDLFRVSSGGPVSGTSIPLGACPVGDPHHFSNDWGNPRGGGSRRHKGTDIFAAHGTGIYAPVAGTITRHRSGGNGGLAMYMWGADGVEYYFAHMSGFSANPGAKVSAGQRIGSNGNSGNARGGPPHLHFEIHPGGGGAINPYPSVVRVC